MKYSRDLLWSRLDITIEAENINEELIEYCFLQVKNFENKYSRFIKWNYLYSLNTTKSSQIDWELFSILQLCLKVSHLTDGNFDITVLPFLENIWYGIEKKVLSENYGYKNIILQDNMVYLKNWVSIDLGGIGKWYMIDSVFKILENYYERFIVNFWWDIKVKWKHTIHLEDPFDSTKSVWTIELEDGSIAWSGPNRRKTKKWHHLINPKLGIPQDDKIAIFVTHKLSSFSDIFSTALFVTPLWESLKILNQIKWLEWLIIAKTWEIYKTKNFNPHLNIW